MVNLVALALRVRLITCDSDDTRGIAQVANRSPPQDCRLKGAVGSADTLRYRGGPRSRETIHLHLHVAPCFSWDHIALLSSANTVAARKYVTI